MKSLLQSGKFGPTLFPSPSVSRVLIGSKEVGIWISPLNSRANSRHWELTLWIVPQEVWFRTP